ncbi:addiction module antidote protein [Pseudomonas amygdali]|uniref:addiction module antidote protein n=1 Tax=Pseudomonas amygdali TaxID=47877 RepID=UPI0039F4CC8A
MRDLSHDQAMAEFFQTHPSYAAELLVEVIRDGNEDELAILERQLLAAVCSGLMKPDTHLGENARQIEVSDDQTTPYLFR